MVSRIEVALKSGLRDARGDRVKRDLARHFAIDVRGVRTLDVYTLDAEFSAEELERIAHGPLNNSRKQNELPERASSAPAVFYFRTKISAAKPRGCGSAAEICFFDRRR